MPARPSDALAGSRATWRRPGPSSAGCASAPSSLDAVGGDAVSDGVPRSGPATAGPRARRRPGHPAVLRPDRRRAEGRWYVGRRHVHDDAGDPLVVDWRADVSRAFYRATRPSRWASRCAAGSATTAARSPRTRTSTSPTATRGRAPQRDPGRARSSDHASGRCATSSRRSSPSRTSIVRADLADTVCVQGAPGTGKTAVGLHRVAYLLYAHRERLRRSGSSWSARTGLPLLHRPGPPGARRAGCRTDHRRRAGRAVHRCAAPSRDDVARLKGDARMAEVLRARRLVARRTADRAARASRSGSRRWRVPPTCCSERRRRAAAPRRAVRRRPRACSPQRLAHEVLVQMEREGATHRRPRPGPRWPGTRPCGRTSTGLAGRRPGSSSCCGC